MTVVKPIDKTGQRFGFLVCIEICKERNNNGRVQWRCKCDCGDTTIVLSDNLISGNTKSCGCIPNPRRTHGKSSTKLYKVWSSMKTRCSNPNDRSYRLYGAKGVAVCDDWQTFKGFHEWALVSGYKPGLTIERLDSDGDYDPRNCTWIPKGDQSNNTSRCVFLTYNGKTLNMKQWSDEMGIPYSLIQYRIKQGWPTEKALTAPVTRLSRCNAKVITVDGKSLSLAEWARELGITNSALWYGIKKAGGKGREKEAIKSKIQQLTGVPVTVA